MKNRLIFILGILTLLFLSGCSDINLSEVSDEDLDRLSDKAVVCNDPYIRVGMECCLDSNSNNICDRDETDVHKELNETIVKQEEKKLIDEYVLLNENIPKGYSLSSIDNDKGLITMLKSNPGQVKEEYKTSFLGQGKLWGGDYKIASYIYENGERGIDLIIIDPTNAKSYEKPSGENNIFLETKEGYIILVNFFGTIYGNSMDKRIEFAEEIVEKYDGVIIKNYSPKDETIVKQEEKTDVHKVTIERLEGDLVYLKAHNEVKVSIEVKDTTCEKIENYNLAEGVSSVELKNCNIKSGKAYDVVVRSEKGVFSAKTIARGSSSDMDVVQEEATGSPITVERLEGDLVYLKANTETKVSIEVKDTTCSKINDYKLVEGVNEIKIENCNIKSGKAYDIVVRSEKGVYSVKQIAKGNSVNDNENSEKLFHEYVLLNENIPQGYSLSPVSTSSGKISYFLDSNPGNFKAEFKEDIESDMGINDVDYTLAIYIHEESQREVTLMVIDPTNSNSFQAPGSTTTNTVLETKEGYIITIGEIIEARDDFTNKLQSLFDGVVRKDYSPEDDTLMPNRVDMTNSLMGVVDGTGYDGDYFKVGFTFLGTRTSEVSYTSESVIETEFGKCTPNEIKNINTEKVGNNIGFLNGQRGQIIYNCDQTIIDEGYIDSSFKIQVKDLNSNSIIHSSVDLRVELEKYVDRVRLEGISFEDEKLKVFFKFYENQRESIEFDDKSIINTDFGKCTPTNINNIDTESSGNNVEFLTGHLGFIEFNCEQEIINQKQVVGDFEILTINNMEMKGRNIVNVNYTWN